MTGALSIPRNERGVVRVFSLSMTPAEAKALKEDPVAVNAMLGAEPHLDASHVEVFPVRDLEDIGLVGYLLEGDAVSADQLAPDRTKLEKLGGWVLIVYSLAFEDRATDLHLTSALTLIGTYGETRTDWTAIQDVTSDAAKPDTTVRKTASDAAISGRIAMLALIVIGLLTALMVWIA